MSETRFILCQDDFGNYEIRYDEEVFHFLWEVAPILNEQQVTISQLEEENKKLIEEWEFSFRTEMAHHRFAEKELQEKIRKKQARIKELEKENEQLRQFITKGRRLSVKELMENTNENELLKKKIMELEKENKELQTELDSFRPVIFHTMQRGTITLYTKGGIDE